jgi:hypothetical protein
MIKKIFSLFSKRNENKKPQEKDLTTKEVKEGLVEKINNQIKKKEKIYLLGQDDLYDGQYKYVIVELESAKNEYLMILCLEKEIKYHDSLVIEYLTRNNLQSLYTHGGGWLNVTVQDDGKKEFLFFDTSTNFDDPNPEIIGNMIEIINGQKDSYVSECSDFDYARSFKRIKVVLCKDPHERNGIGLLTDKYFPLE